MGRYFTRRLLQAIPMLLLLSIVLFALVNIAPGGPLAGYGRSRRIRPEKAQILKRQFGLDTAACGSHPSPVADPLSRFGDRLMLIFLLGMAFACLAAFRGVKNYAGRTRRKTDGRYQKSSDIE